MLEKLDNEKQLGTGEFILRTLLLNNNLSYAFGRDVFTSITSLGRQKEIFPAAKISVSSSIYSAIWATQSNPIRTDNLRFK